MKARKLDGNESGACGKELDVRGEGADRLHRLERTVACGHARRRRGVLAQHGDDRQPNGREKVSSFYLGRSHKRWPDSFHDSWPGTERLQRNLVKSQPVKRELVCCSGRFSFANN